MCRSLLSGNQKNQPVTVHKNFKEVFAVNMLRYLPIDGARAPDMASSQRIANSEECLTSFGLPDPIGITETGTVDVEYLYHLSLFEPPGLGTISSGLLK